MSAASARPLRRRRDSSLVHGRQAVAHRVLGDPLQVQIQRRVHVDRLGGRRGQAGVVVVERLGDVVDEVAAPRPRARAARRRAAPAIARSATSCSMNSASTIACRTTLRRSRDRVGVVERRQRARRLQHAGDRRRFGQRDVADILAEEEPRGLRHADNRERPALTERHVVQVHLENLVLRRARVEDQREELLEQLAPHACPRRSLARSLQRPAVELRQKHVADHLLGDRAGAGERPLSPLRFETTARRIAIGSMPGW